MKRVQFRFLFTLVAAIGILLPLTVTADSHGDSETKATKVATVEGITEYRLDNGLRFLLFPDRSKETITVNITYMVGSRHEAYGETGMAHLLEHLVFKGTPNHPDIASELTERGSAPNGSTGFDRTNYFETLKATDDNLEWALDLEADRMVNSYVSAEDLETERTVVRNEWERGENSPPYVLRKRLRSTAFTWHNYGNSVIGSRSDIENVPIQRLKDFYRKYYQPDNAILVVAGKFEVDRAIELVEQKFGVIPAPDRSGDNLIYDTYTREPAQDGERSVTLQRIGEVQLAYAGWHVPAAAHPTSAAFDVLASVLGDYVSGRLHKRVVKNGWAARSWAFTDQGGRDPGLFISAVEVRKHGDLELATRAMLDIVAGIATDEPPTEEEVNRVKTKALSNFELAFNDPQSIALSISNWAAQGDWRLMFLWRDNMEALEVEDVAQVAKDHLLDSNRTIATFLPTEETPPRVEVPEAPDIMELVSAYEGREAIAEGEDFDPSPMNIENRTEYLTLSSGVRVALLAKENRGDEVRFSVALPHGAEEGLMGLSETASLAGSMLMRGTANRDREQIQDRLAELKAQGSVGGGATGLTGNFRTVRESLPDVLELMKELLREPSFDAGEFDVLLQSRITDIEESMSEPRYLASIHLRQHTNPYPKGHPWYPATAEERLETLRSTSLDDVKEFAANFHGTTEMSRVAVVGDFDRDVVVPLLEDVFSGWESPASYHRVENKYFGMEGLELDVEAPDKENAVMYAFLQMPIGTEHEDYPALEAGNYLLGGGFLSSRLATRIRQNEGWSYGVGSGINSSEPDELSSFFGQAIFAPQNADNVKMAFLEEIQKVLDDGYSEDEVAGGVKGMLDGRQRRRASDSTIARMLLSNMYLGRTMDWVVDYESRLAAVTPESILEAMREHLTIDNISIVRAGDFAGVKADADDGE